jgi:AraC-like DNA-binding protein
MSAVLRTQTGIYSYDRARWTGWVPDRLHVRRGAGLAMLLQSVQPGMRGSTITDVPVMEDTSLLFWTKGQAVEYGFNAPRRRYVHRPWEYAVLPPGCISSWVSTPLSSDGVLHLHLEAGFLARVAEEEGVDPHPREAHGACDPVVRHVATWLLSEAQEGRTASKLLWQTIGTTLAMRLLRVAERHDMRHAGGGLSPAKLRRAMDLLLGRLDGEVTLTELATELGTSTSHVSRAFKASTGLPPWRWLAERRIERAKELLAEPRLSLTDVVQMVGYTGQTTFGEAFRRATGMTPGQYRREVLK